MLEHLTLVFSNAITSETWSFKYLGLSHASWNTSRYHDVVGYSLISLLKFIKIILTELAYVACILALHFSYLPNVQVNVGVFMLVPVSQVHWGQIEMIDAERRLLTFALQDLDNQYFALLSESYVISSLHWIHGSWLFVERLWKLNSKSSIKSHRSRCLATEVICLTDSFLQMHTSLQLRVHLPLSYSLSHEFRGQVV